MQKLSSAKLTVRNASLKDADAIAALNKRVYGEYSFQDEHVRGHINAFPQGQFVAEYEGKVVGYCATFMIDGDMALKPHVWREITGHGFASRHDLSGDYLYGMEVCVDPDYRSLRIGQRLYTARKKLCQQLGLKGIVFGGRLPGYAKRMKKIDGPEHYIDLVKQRKLRDPVLSFQLANGFEVIGVLPNYLLHDKDSACYAAHLLWRNPLAAPDKTKGASSRARMPNSVRVVTVQFQVRKVASEDEFEQQLAYFAEVASDYKADFVLFPELLTVPLLSSHNKRLTPAESIEWLTSYTDRFVKFMEHQAIRRNVNIIAGTHPTRREDGIYNVSYVFLRDGSIYSQTKIHPTPNERYWWNIKGGTRVDTIPTDCGSIGVLICYDSEFPELARHLADQGALFLFIPYCTDERQGHLRVRYCAQARAIENQFYVATAGMVGNLPDVENMDIHYAESCIVTPCDFNFARDGIAAVAAPNTEMICLADLRPENLFLARNNGTVQNMKDRRFDLYKVEWMGD